MDIRLQNQLTRLCKFPASQKWELKYRASIDGFESSDFHSHCDGIANTLTIIKAKGGNIFGGFTEKQWHSRSQFVTDPKAFIFSLVNKEVKPFKVMSSNEGKQAICCNPAFGPCFGGYGYQHPDYVRETDRAQNILAGSNNFEIEEIEIFTKTN